MNFLILTVLLGAAAHAAGPECEIDGAAVAAADTARARIACETARARFAELFGEPVPIVHVVLWDRPGYRTGVQDGRATVFWPRASARSREEWQNVLPHEIAHTLLVARFEDSVHRGAGAEYGTTFPDWLEEGVAIWAESMGNRRGRLAQARALPASRRQLGSILTSAHPAVDNPAVYGMRDGAAPPKDAAFWAFYPQSIAVLSFIYDAGGRPAVLELVRRLATAPPDRDLLAGLPGLPAAAADVQGAWRRWLTRSSHTRPD